MNTLQIIKKEEFKITGDWIAQSKVLKDKYIQLKDANLSIENQEESVMLLMLENTLHKTPTQIKNIIKRTQTDVLYFKYR